jgi:hypothetical protein
MASVVHGFKTGHALMSSIFRDEIAKALKIIEQDALKDYAKTVVTWNDKPKFTSKISMQNPITLEVGTDDAVYGYVDLGTKPHIIRAKTPKGLFFKGRTKKGKPKTTPNIVQSFPGQPGEGLVNIMQVNHPGNKPRQFSHWIEKTYKAELDRELKNALERFKRRVEQ